MTQKTADYFKPYDERLRAGKFQYDGQYVYAMTYDPLLINRRFVPAIEFPKYRYQRMLYPLLAHALSFGRPRLYPLTLFLINIFAYGAGCFIVWQMVKLNGWTPVLILGYLCNTGLLFSVFGTLTEPLALTFSLWGIYLWQKNEKTKASIVFAASILARETFLIIPVTVILWDFCDSQLDVKKMLSYISMALIPFLLWYVYVSFRLPREDTFQTLPWMPHSIGVSRFSLPFIAMWQETLYGIRQIATTGTVIKLSLSISVMTTACMIISAVGFFRNRDFWSSLAFSQGVFTTMLRGDLWTFHAGSARVVIPFTFFTMAWLANELKNEQLTEQSVR